MRRPLQAIRHRERDEKNVGQSGGDQQGADRPLLRPRRSRRCSGVSEARLPVGFTNKDISVDTRNPV